MKIKALLLGSAAAVVMAGGATAADLPAAAPADYVMVCGDFSQSYVIPGTDVCLDIGGAVSFEVDVMRTGGATTVDYSTDADLHFTASTATEYGALIAHIELEADDIVTMQGAATPASALMYDDVYIQFGGDLFVKAGYYDGVGDAGDDISTVDNTGQGDTVGMGYGMDSFSFAVDVLLDSQDATGALAEGVGATATFSGLDGITLGAFGNAALAGASSMAAGGSVSWSMDALALTLVGYYETAGFNSFTVWGNATYAVTDALSVYIDAEFSTAGSTSSANAIHVDVGADYTVTSGLSVGVNAGASRIDGTTSYMFGADATRSF